MDDLTETMDDLTKCLGVPRFYYRPDPLDPTQGLTVQALGIHERMAPRLVRHHRFPFVLLAYFCDEVEIEVDGRLEPQSAGSVVLWREGRDSVYGNRDRPWCHHWLLLAGPQAIAAIAPEPIPFERPIRIASAEFLRICLEQLRDELIRGETPPDAVVVGNSLRIVSRQLRRALGGPADATASALDRVHAYIEAHISRTMTLDELADTACLSVSRFSELFGRRFGCSPMRYVSQLRLRRAAILLNDPSLSVAQVAASTGFEDPLYFSRRFRQQFGLSPTHYRRDLLAQPPQSGR